MKKMICLPVAAVLCGLFAGCASTTVFDASDPTVNTARAIGTVSHAECLMAARAAADYIAGMTDRFAENEYRRLTGEQREG